VEQFPKIDKFIFLGFEIWDLEFPIPELFCFIKMSVCGFLWARRGNDNLTLFDAGSRGFDSRRVHHPLLVMSFG